MRQQRRAKGNDAQAFGDDPTMTSSSTALARIDKKPEAEAEAVPAMTSLPVPIALLLAAESVAAKADKVRTYLAGVYVHRKGDKGRVVATDGARMFVASFPLPSKGKVPTWLQDGVILSRDSLRSRVQLLGKLSDEKDVLVSYAKGSASAEIADAKAETVFRIKTQDGTFPDYDNILGSKSFSDFDEEGNQASREWQPVGINSTYLKQCGDIAKTLEAGLDKEARSKLGMVIRAFNGGDTNAPLVFDFATWPGAVLVVMPAVMASRATSKETAAILAPALKSTVAALRAHATRWDQRVAELTDETAKAEAAAKAEGFRQRVAAILTIVPAGPAIGQEKPTSAEAKQPQPEPTKPEPAPAKTEDEQKPEVEAKATVGDADPEARRETKRPATKRTKIKVPHQHANGAAAA